MDPEPVAGLFGFESFMEPALEHMPMSVRMNLDLAGARLSRAHWRGLPLAVRQIVLEMGCESDCEPQRMRRYLEFTIEAFGLGPVLPILCDPRSWGAQSEVPSTVAAALQSLGLPRLPASAWTRLSDLQRCALIKLTGDGMSRNLPAALQEFGLGEPCRPPAGREPPEAPGRTDPPIADALLASRTGGPEAQVFAFVARALRECKPRKFGRAED